MRGIGTRAQMPLKLLGADPLLWHKKMGFLAQKRPEIFSFFICAFTFDASSPPPPPVLCDYLQS
jgi:hypothetical protein